MYEIIIFTLLGRVDIRTNNTIRAYEIWRNLVENLKPIGDRGILSWVPTGEIIEEFGYEDEE